MSWLTNEDFRRWQEGTFYDSYNKLGAHPTDDGTWFSVWAPHADHVAVLGEFNGWDGEASPLERGEAGLWEGFVHGAKVGHHYKFRLRRWHHMVDKTDPYAFAMEPPASGGSALAGLAAQIIDTRYDWQDAEWMKARRGPETMADPIAIYEVHLGSWRKNAEGYSLSYRDLAEPLAEYVKEMGFTHVELLPIMEHPYYGSWGYQVIGYFAPTYRFGHAEDLKYLIDYLHQHHIGVLLDWVPAHFATDPQGLVFYDGSTLFEYDDPQMRYHPDWGTYVFDYNKPGVRNFLISNALYWLKEFHIDGLRFDAVASMLYRDYSRGAHWSPNLFGGRENLEAIDFLKKINEIVYQEVPKALMIAEESTAWPGVSAPTYDGGLGFLYKWNMGWMHDTLEYLRQDPVHRRFHHENLTFPLVYAYSEHYTLPLSHDEVVHGKGSLWNKMPGDPWQKAANLRLLFGHMVGHPGKKLLFMGGEIGQVREWSHDRGLDWHLLDDPLHSGVQGWVRDLFRLYREHPALWNDQPGGFDWIDLHDRDQSIISYLRRGGGKTLVFIFNFTPIPRHNYRIGVPMGGFWRERLNSDAAEYGGSGVGNYGGRDSHPVPYHGSPESIVVTLPPLGVLIFEPADAA